MKTPLLRSWTITGLAVIAFTQSAFAANVTWSAGSGVDLLWSTTNNWSPAAVPGANDDARFFSAGASNDLTSITAVITNNQTIHSLWLGPTNSAAATNNGVHNIRINAGVTLTVAGTNDNGWGPLGSKPDATASDLTNGVGVFYFSTIGVGSKTEISASQTVSNTISGNGTLVVNNTNNEINVRQVFGNTGGPHRAVLDLSGLDTLVANLGRIRVGDGEAGAVRRAEGHLYLARTNTITLSGTNFQENVQLLVGNNDVNFNQAAPSVMQLGQQNTINVDEILVGGRKQPGTIQFNTNFTAPNLVLRGSAGTNRVRAFRIGDQSNQSNSGNGTTGIADFGIGTQDILADTVIIAKGQAGTGTAGSGTLSLGAGTLDVNTLEFAYQVAPDTANPETGTLNLSNTTVVVNQLLRFGHAAGGTGARNSFVNMGGGTFTVRSNLQIQGATTLNITNGTLALVTRPALGLAGLYLDGGTISNAASLKVTNSLSIANNGVILGNPVFDLGNNSANWNTVGALGGGLAVSNAIQGAGNYSGNLIIASNAVFSPGGDGVAGTFSMLSGDMTLNGGSVLKFDLNNSVFGINDAATLFGTLTANGTNDISLTALGGSFDTANPYTLITASILVGNQNNFRIAGGLANSRYNFAIDTTSTPNSVKLSVSGTGPANLTWVGDGVANVWDLKGATNWNNGAPSQFFSLDNVSFTDAGSATPALSLAGTLAPGAITFNNSAKSYTFGGAGALNGSAFTKNGSGGATFTNAGNLAFAGAFVVSNGPVTLANTGANTFAGGLTVAGGSVTLSGNNTNTVQIPFSLSSGLTVYSGGSLTVANVGANDFGGGTIQLDGPLTINQAVDSTLDGDISGNGSITKAGAGIVTLNGNDGNLANPLIVAGGTLKLGLSGIVPNAGLIVSNGARININGRSIAGIVPVIAGAGPDGQGALVNFGAPQASAASFVVLTGDTTVGGSGPWNTDPVLDFGRLYINSGELSTSNQPFSLTKAGGNEVRLSAMQVDPALADIDVQGGALGLSGNTTLGNPANTLTVRAGATLSLSASTVVLDKKFVLFGNGVTPNVFDYNGANVVAGTVTLNGNCVVSAAPADRGTPVSIAFDGPIGGTGGLTKISIDALILDATNTYSGATVINAGSLVLSDTASISNSSTLTLGATAVFDLSTRTNNTFVLASGQTLDGSGTVWGGINSPAGSTVAPGGASIGTLTVTNGVTLRGTTSIQLNKGAATNDVLASLTGISYGGTLSVSNISGALAGGDSFKIFNAASYSDSFTSITPATPGAGLAWDTSSLGVDGRLKILSTGPPPQPRIVSVTLSGGNVVISGTNGTASGNYYVLVSSNITLPVSNWSPILTGTFSGGNFTFTNAVNPGLPRRFYILQLP